MHTPSFFADTGARVVLRTAGVLGVLVALLPRPGAALEKGEFDPAAWDALLHQYVQDGLVDYRAWQEAGTEALDAFLDEAATYDLGATMGKEPKAAFLTNVYNAWAIRQILDHYPVESVQDIPGFLDGNERQIAGEPRTLAEVEETLAGIMRHSPEFALLLVPGTSGWPVLGAEAYTGENYQKRLREVKKEAFQGGHIRLDEETNRLHLPDPIARYMELYEATPNGFLGHFSEQLPLGVVVTINNKKPETVVDPVDWSLNDTAQRDVGEHEDPGVEPQDKP